MNALFGLVGETLRRVRKERGKTLEQLGQEAGLGRGQLSRIENSRQEATLTTLAKILGSQGVSRREFFRRYDLVEAEASALASVEGAAADAADSGAESAGSWPAEIRDVLGKLESFVSTTFHQPRPVASGAIEIGDLVVLFRVVPKSLPEPPPAKTKPVQEDAEAPAPSRAERRSSRKR